MYREILTKAIIAKGEKTIIDEYNIKTEHTISKVLGCWIINHIHNVYLQNQKVFIKGSYEANFWYGYDDNTKCSLLTKTYEFNDEIPFNYTLEKSNLSEKNELLDYEITPPSCFKMTFENDELIIKVERKYAIDIIGETKIKIKVDDVIIDQMINTDYVNERKQ